jgi:hypothetical protein
MNKDEKIKAAQNEYLRKWRNENREKINEYNRKWRAENKDKVQEYQDRYFLKKYEEMKSDEIEKG